MFLDWHSRTGRKEVKNRARRLFGRTPGYGRKKVMVKDMTLRWRAADAGGGERGGKEAFLFGFVFRRGRKRENMKQLLA